MKILLLFDVDFEINKNRICDFLNNKTTHLKFVNGGDINIDSDIISKPDSFISILNKINKSAPIRVTIQNICSSKFLILMVGLNKTERIKKIIVMTEIITEPINIKSLPELL